MMSSFEESNLHIVQFASSGVTKGSQSVSSFSVSFSFSLAKKTTQSCVQIVNTVLILRFLCFCCLFVFLSFELFNVVNIEKKTS